MSDITITPAHAADLDVVEAFLEQAHLPVDGLHAHTQHMFVARDGNRIVGCVSLELYGDAGLLRSLAVDAEYRREGVGARLVDEVLHLASLRGVTIVYLLTSTAEGYFPRFGFEMTDRGDVPPAVRMSAEFSGSSCADAHVMRKFLGRT